MNKKAFYFAETVFGEIFATTDPTFHEARKIAPKNMRYIGRFPFDGLCVDIFVSMQKLRRHNRGSRRHLATKGVVQL